MFFIILENWCDLLKFASFNKYIYNCKLYIFELFISGPSRPPQFHSFLSSLAKSQDSSSCLFCRFLWFLLFGLLWLPSPRFGCFSSLSPSLLSLSLSLSLSIYLSISFSLSLSLIITESGFLTGLRRSVCIAESQRVLCVSFIRRGSDFYIHYLEECPNFNLLHHSQWIIFVIHSCIYV